MSGGIRENVANEKPRGTKYALAMKGPITVLFFLCKTAPLLNETLARL